MLFNRLKLFAAAAAVATIALPAQAVPISADAKVGDIPTTAGNGLKGSFYDTTGTGSVSQAWAQIDAMGTPTATFVSTAIYYPRGSNFTSDTTPLASYLADDAASLSGAGASTLDGSIFTFTGYIAIDESFDQNQSLAGIQAQFWVGSDDGFELSIGGTSLGSAGDRSFTYSYMPAEFAEAGLYSFSLMYYENGGSTGVQFWSTTNYSTQVLQARHFYHSAPVPTPEPAAVGLLGLGLLGIARLRKRKG